MSNITITINIEDPELSNALQALVAGALSGVKPNAVAVETKPVTKTEVQQQPDTSKPEQPSAPDLPAAPVITLEEVRAKLAALSQSGKQAQVKELITKFGASKLTEIPAEKYADLLEEAKAIA